MDNCVRSGATKRHRFIQRYTARGFVHRVCSEYALKLLCTFLLVQVAPAGECKLKWVDPDEAGLLKFLVEEKG